MVFDFRLARACDFDGIQEIFAHYVSNTVMTLVHNVPSTLGRIQHTTEFPRDEDDETPAYPVYLPVPVLVAHHITDDGKKPQIVGYTFLGPARNRDARNSASMELYLFVHPDYVRQGIGGALLSMLLTLVHSSRGIRCFEWVIAGEEEELFFAVKPYKTTRITVSVSVDPDSEDGGEWLPEWFKTKGFVEYKRLKGYSVKFNRVIDNAYLEYTVREIESDESDSEPESEPDSNVDGSDNEFGNVESDDTNGNGGNEGHAGSV